MITLNNKKFYESNDEYLNSLFVAGGTPVGYAKRNRRSINLYNHDQAGKVLIGCINRYGVLCRADINEDGKAWYSFGDIDVVGHWKSRVEQHEIIQSLAVRAENGQYWFKEDKSAYGAIDSFIDAVIA